MIEVLVMAAGAMLSVPLILVVLRAVANDGYGQRPLPRSHRDEVAVTQDERLRRLAR